MTDLQVARGMLALGLWMILLVQCSQPTEPEPLVCVEDAYGDETRDDPMEYER